MLIVRRIKYVSKCRLAAPDRSMAGYNAMTCSVVLQGCGIKIFLWGQCKMFVDCQYCSCRLIDIFQHLVKTRASLDHAKFVGAAVGLLTRDVDT